MMCELCPQGIDCYDLVSAGACSMSLEVRVLMPPQCLTCAMSRTPMQHHGTSHLHKKFRYVQWLPNYLPGGMAQAQVFRLNWRWNCDGVHPQCMKRMNGPFFHCIDCGDNGFDLVSQAALFLSLSLLKLTLLAC
jgi:hypothetical protein